MVYSTVRNARRFGGNAALPELGFSRIAATVSGWRRQRLVQADLARLDDRVLRDLGLTRAQVDGYDPGPLLKDRLRTIGW